MDQYITSWIRTVVPIALGPILTWVVTKFGVSIDQESMFAVVSAILSAGYYSLARFLELKFPEINALQRLLGSAKQPSYTPPPVP